MNYNDMVRKILSSSDVAIEVVDARFPERTRNFEFEGRVKASGKKLLLVLNKADLISLRAAKLIKRGIEAGGLKTVFVSAKKRQGVARLKSAIAGILGGMPGKAAGFGYPNTGKSSVINMLKGRKSAPTSSTAGFTKGLRNVRIGAKITLIDSPGIIPLHEHDETLMALLGVKNPEQVKDLEGTGLDVADLLLKNSGPETIAFYGVGSARDGEELLEKIASGKNRLLKGGKPDTNAAARMLLNDLLKGRINLKEGKTNIKA